MEAFASLNLQKLALLPYQTPTNDSKRWNSIIKHHTKLKDDHSILTTYTQMESQGILADPSTLPLVLKACGKLQAIERGKKIHNDIWNTNLIHDVRVQTALVDFYCKCGLIQDALYVFDEITDRDLVSWNAMISGYVGCSCYVEAIMLFTEMQRENLRPNSVTVVALLSACGELLELRLGKEIHGYCLRNRLFDCNAHVGTALVGFYSRFGVEIAGTVFEMMVLRNVVSWNAMISGYFDAGDSWRALVFFVQMIMDGYKCDSITMLIVIQACSEVGSLKLGMQVHQLAIKYGFIEDLFIVNALLNMYSMNGCLASSLQLFESTPTKDIALWNSIMSMYVEIGFLEKVMSLFIRMRLEGIREDERTIAILLSSYVDLDNALSNVKSLHAHVIKRAKEMTTYLGNAFLSKYVELNCIQDAFKVFDDIGDSDVISWNTLISALARNGFRGQAWELFEQMQQSDIEPNSHTIISTLAACDNESFLSIGSIQYAEQIFKILPRRNAVSWNAMIDAYGMHGRGYDAMLSFSQMLEDGFKPNGITFVSALSACSHSGLVEKGLQLFHSMVQDFCITPELVHYGCVVDMLGRAGCLDEAREFINLMPIAPDASVWRALLSACRVYSEIKLAKTVFEKLIELEPTNAGNYVLLSNIYAAAGLWSVVRKLRVQVEEEGLNMPPGKSWIVVRSKIHCFTAGDKSHPQSDKIYAELSSLLSSIKKVGYVPDLNWVLHEEEDEEKTKRLFSHSEKLAIAFGLISVSGGTPILINKNLRVCGDCHEFGKYVSKLVGREIVLRDGSRFHHFVNGLCSCKDYW
ncbi:Pentatricopeptide repeat-containing protein [Camellia lanceoleosa]|uniref:Pentatricopeptide repeat-containing protein n=1 Tax=Camellia lanceoleosa TaxID=1840588 RepID=A0ACC0F3E9_9ERIC|nr:Pentatricopeptide repeat-containing protein [Camellia lanceoleosa]